MDKSLIEEEIFCALEECSDVDSGDDAIPDNENSVIPGPSRCPDVKVLGARDYPAESGEQDNADSAEHFVGTYKKNIRWKRSRDPYVCESQTFKGTFNDQHVHTAPESPYEYFRRYIDDAFFAEAAHFTNLYAEQNKENRKGNFKPTNTCEIRVLIAQHIMKSRCP